MIEKTVTGQTILETVRETKFASTQTLFPADTANADDIRKIELWIGNSYREAHKDDKFFIDSNDKEFYRTMEDDEFLLSQGELLAAVDKAKIVNIEKLKIETPHGVTDFKDISTGLKTLLNVLHKIRRNPEIKFCFNLDECGNEVLSMIFDRCKGSKASFYLSRPFYIKDFNINFGDYVINGIFPESKEQVLSIMKEI